MNLKKYFAECKAEAQLAKKLATHGDMESYHFWHGIISGFPPCCINFYVYVWTRGLLEKKLRRDTPMYKDKLQRGNRIMCPDCISRGLKNVRELRTKRITG